MTSVDILTVLMHIGIVEDERDLRAQFAQMASVSCPTIVSFINQHGLNLAFEDPALREAFLRSDYLLRDGVGLEVALRLVGLRSGMNCPGTDLIPLLISTLPGRKIAAFGTRDPWLTRASNIIAEVGLDVVAKLDGFRPEQDYLAAVEASRPDIVILAMGMPRQEKLALRIAEGTCYPILIVNGGAILDFMAHRFSRAPRWIRAARLEWLFRLILEPRRLARRYVWGGALFVVRLLSLARHGARVGKEAAELQSLGRRNAGPRRGT